MPLIELANVGKTYRSLRGADYQALKDMNLRIDAGEFFCLLGTSGCGKTTVLNMVAGFEQHTEGRLLINNRPLAGPGADRGVVFQGDDSLYPWLTALGNIEFGLRMSGVTARGTPRTGAALSGTGRPERSGPQASAGTFGRYETTHPDCPCAGART